MNLIDFLQVVRGYRVESVMKFTLMKVINADLFDFIRPRS
ncbi:hypothetical protein VIRA109638_04920 [Vibrio rarus]